MIHIVFQQNDVAVIKQAMELEPALQGEVFEIRDEWGVGPLEGLDTPEGWTARENWWRMLLEKTNHPVEEVGSFDDRKTVEAIQHWLTENETGEVWIWMGQNQHDVTGYYWLMPQLREFQGRAMVLYLNNLPFLNEKGQLFYPAAIHEVLPKEAVKARRLARPITLSEFEVDPDEYKKLAEENALVRILEGGKKIVGKGADFYDEDILKNISSDWQKAWRILGNTMNRMKIKTGDVYLMWRIRELVDAGRLEVSGSFGKGWKEIELRQQTATAPEQTSLD